MLKTPPIKNDFSICEKSLFDKMKFDPYFEWNQIRITQNLIKRLTNQLSVSDDKLITNALYLVMSTNSQDMYEDVNYKFKQYWFYLYQELGIDSNSKLNAKLLGEINKAAKLVAKIDTGPSQVILSGNALYVDYIGKKSSIKISKQQLERLISIIDYDKASEEDTLNLIYCLLCRQKCFNYSTDNINLSSPKSLFVFRSALTAHGPYIGVNPYFEQYMGALPISIVEFYEELQERLEVIDLSGELIEKELSHDIYFVRVPEDKVINSFITQVCYDLYYYYPYKTLGFISNKSSFAEDINPFVHSIGNTYLIEPEVLEI